MACTFSQTWTQKTVVYGLDLYFMVEYLSCFISILTCSLSHSFMEIDHEIFSTVILSLSLIQEGQLSVSGDRMCTILVNRLED